MPELARPVNSRTVGYTEVGPSRILSWRKIAKALTDADYSPQVGIAHGIRRLALGHWSQSQLAFELSRSRDGRCGVGFPRTLLAV
jgi:hypothetical protein